MCDYDGVELGMDNNPFLSIWGTISDQIEDTDGVVQYRYLTNTNQAKLAFCTGDCLLKWLDEQRNDRQYVERG